jgi:hypothetical protein
MIVDRGIFFTYVSIHHFPPKAIIANNTKVLSGISMYWFAHINVFLYCKGILYGVVL